MTRWIGGDGARPTCELLLQPSPPAGINNTAPFVTSTSDGVVNTASGLNFGAENPRRSIAALITINGIDTVVFPSFDYAKIGGVTAGIAESILYRNGSNFLWSVIAIANVPTNSDTSFEWATDSLLNKSATTNGCQLYRCQNLRSLTPAGHGTDTNNSSSTPVSVNINVPAGGVVIASSATFKGSTQFPPASWSGVSNDGIFSPLSQAGWWAYSGHSVQAAANSGLTVSNLVNISERHILAAASFR